MQSTTSQRARRCEPLALTAFSYEADSITEPRASLSTFTSHRSPHHPQNLHHHPRTRYHLRCCRHHLMNLLCHALPFCLRIHERACDLVGGIKPQCTQRKEGGRSK